MQVQFPREKFSSLDIEVDGGLSPSTIDTAAQVCVCVCVSYNHFFPPSLFPLTPPSSPSSSLSGPSKGLLYIHVTHFNMLTTRLLVIPQLVVSCLPLFLLTYVHYEGYAGYNFRVFFSSRIRPCSRKFYPAKLSSHTVHTL